MSPDQDVLQARESVYSEKSLENVSEWCPLSPEIGADDFSVQVARSTDAVEALRPAWTKWAHSLDTDLDYYLQQMSQNLTSLEPYVITVYHGGVARAMLVGQVRKRSASTVISFVNIPGPRMRVLEINKGGRMGQPSADVDKLLAAELLRAMKRGDADSICFERLPLQSGIFREMQRLPGFAVKKRVPHVFYYSELPLSDASGKRPHVFSGKIGREFRRKTRIMEQAFPGQVSLKCFSRPEELNAGLGDALRVVATTWQSYLGLGLIDSSQVRESYRFLAEQGWLRIYILYVKDAPCAFLAGQLYNDTFYCQYAGYNPDFAPFSVGSLLTARVFEILAATGVQRVDLGEGGQEHNRRLGCQKREEGTVHVYSPTLRGVWLNLFFGTAQIVRSGGRRTRLILHLSWLAKIWKEFLISRGAVDVCLSGADRHGNESLRKGT